MYTDPLRKPVQTSPDSATGVPTQPARTPDGPALAGHSYAALSPHPPVQRYSVPDDAYNNKTTGDDLAGAIHTVEALPGIGNIASAVETGLGTALLGYDTLAGNKKEASNDLNVVEDSVLNIIPGLGNLRAAGEAGQDWSARANDSTPVPAGVNPDTVNPNSMDRWMNGGADKFNKSVSDTWNSFFP